MPLVRRLLPDFAFLGLAAVTVLFTAVACGRTLGTVFVCVIIPSLLAIPLWPLSRYSGGSWVGARTSIDIDSRMRPRGPHLISPGYGGGTGDDPPPTDGSLFNSLATLFVAAACCGGAAAWAAGMSVGIQTFALAFTLAASIFGVIALLARCGLPIELARGFAGVLLLAWLTWPVWMAPHWASPAVSPWLDPLAVYQPLLAINGPALALGPWSHQPIAYRYLLSLGQDVPYLLPPSAWSAVTAHGVAALTLIGVSSIGRRRGRDERMAATTAAS